MSANNIIPIVTEITWESQPNTYINNPKHESILSLSADVTSGLKPPRVNKIIAIKGTVKLNMARMYVTERWSPKKEITISLGSISPASGHRCSVHRLT